MVNIVLLFTLLLLQGCGSVHIVQNQTNQNQAITILYKNNDQSTRYKIDHYEEKRTITNLNKACDSNTCKLTFDLLPNKNLSLTNILSDSYLTTVPKEERLIFVNGNNKNGEDDTIFYKSGRRIQINRFENRSKISNVLTLGLGTKFFVYEFN